MVMSLTVCLSDAVGEAVTGTAAGPSTGERREGGSPSQPWVGSVRGQRCLPGSAVVWGPSCGAFALHIQGWG